MILVLRPTPQFPQSVMNIHPQLSESNNALSLTFVKVGN